MCFGLRLFAVYDNCKAFALRAGAGVVKQQHDNKYEQSCFQVFLVG